MKKIYVKPEAMTVAFAVNENIATSGFYTEAEDGVVTYKQDEVGCNDILNGTNIETGLPDGETDINMVMKHLEQMISQTTNQSALKELWAVLNMLKDEKKPFVCA
jgi:hypothetical protein